MNRKSKSIQFPKIISNRNVKYKNNEMHIQYTCINKRDCSLSGVLDLEIP